MKFQQPYQQAMYYCSLILQDQTWPWNDELEALSHLDADNLANFYPLMLSRAFIECYIAGSYISGRCWIIISYVNHSYLWDYNLILFVSGNVEANEAESMIEHVENVFFKGSHPISQALFPSQHLTNRVIKLETGINYFYSAEGLNPSDENSALIHYIQVLCILVKGRNNRGDSLMNFSYSFIEFMCILDPN